MLFRPGEVGCNLDGSRTLSTSPVVLHIVRPYATVEEYLAAEAWTIDTRAMVLVDAADLAPDTAILFDVAIGSGEKLIRAEGKVAAKIAPQGGRPGGLRVKFKRYGAATKAFIDRAMQARQAAALPEGPVSVAPVSRTSVTEVELQKAEAAAPPAPAPEPAPAPPEPAPAPAAAPEAQAAPPPASRPEAREPSGVHRRPKGPVDVPPNRDELLARLRERAGNVDINAISAPAADKTA